MRLRKVKINTNLSLGTYILVNLMYINKIYIHIYSNKG